MTHEHDLLDPRIPRPSLVKLALEWRAVSELISYLHLEPLLARSAQGDGHPVLILPGFMAGDLSTRPLRGFLRKRGWVASPWKMGANLGATEAVKDGLRHRLEYLHRRYGKPVSLLGWSLGGFYAREMAREAPELVRQVITLGTPFNGHPSSSNVAWLFAKLTGQDVDANVADLLERMQTPLQVPTTSIFSQSDGVVAWQACLDHDDRAQAENIQVYGSHCGLGHNPLALLAIADRLSQPHGEWRPFDRSGVRRLMFPDWSRAHIAWRRELLAAEAAGARALDRLLAGLYEKLMRESPART